MKNNCQKSNFWTNRSVLGFALISFLSLSASVGAQSTQSDLKVGAAAIDSDNYTHPDSRYSHSFEPLSDIIVFAGPLGDIGNLASVAGDLPPPFFNNRLSNGPVAIEVVAKRFGIELKPSLHRIGPSQGNNYSSGDALAAGEGPQDLAGQLDAYFASTGNTADPDALYYLSIGGNEVLAATLESDNEASEKLLDAAVHAKEKAIRRLVNAGAKTILTGNFLDIGVAPQIRSAGLSERGKRMSAYYNRNSARMLDWIRWKLDFQLIRHDFQQFVVDGLRNSKSLGYTNTTDSCLEKLATGECDFDRFIFFNEVFPTASIHELWGWDILSTVVTQLRQCHQIKRYTSKSRKCGRQQFRDERRQSHIARHPIN